MCEACLDRARRLRELVVHFQQLADQAGDSISADRLRRTVAELQTIAAQLPRTENHDDIVWAEDRDEGPGDTGAEKTA